ncbi:MAG: bifunctional transcriptional activator/DNA repair enzyme protein Ada, partial [Sphingomonadales bacterium]
MQPNVWKDGGLGAVIRWAVVDTSLGHMLVAASEKGICRLSFDEDEGALLRRFPRAQILVADAYMAEVAKPAATARLHL